MPTKSKIFLLTFTGLQRYLLLSDLPERSEINGRKKMGRPTDSPKDITIKIRFDKESSDKLVECSEQMKISRAEVVRRGVKKMFDDLDKNKKEVATTPTK